VLTITLNRPEQLNAVNAVMHAELPEALGRIAGDSAVRAVVLTGAGRAFNAGGDFDFTRRMMDDPVHRRRILLEAYDIVQKIVNLPQPIIAAVNGPAIGLGATLALFCDMAIAGQQAFLSDPHVPGMGVAAGDGGAVIWPLLIGHQRAKQYLLTGDRVDATTAAEIGLINMVVPDSELQKVSIDWAKRFASGPSLAVQYTKQMVNRHVNDAILKVLDASLAVEALCFVTEDAKEALTAWGEKRTPVFKGK
jgi:enoyl-CoA hydratase